MGPPVRRVAAMTVNSVSDTNFRNSVSDTDFSWARVRRTFLLRGGAKCENI